MVDPEEPAGFVKIGVFVANQVELSKDPSTEREPVGVPVQDATIAPNGRERKSTPLVATLEPMLAPESTVSGPYVLVPANHGSSFPLQRYRVG